ncbi:MAG: chemotaxis protein CheW [Gammaproteobacteria bacterium]|nr:chemotaxis protein CheW [Gammaproteobacteria bacterium]MDH5799549.1 chemotaxis protein CheW [Gammaproteobacteria bacterium]
MPEEKKLVVRSQLIPLNNMRLVLPNTAIAEVISLLKPQPVDSSVPWLLGMASWRGLLIPIISFETASKGEPAKMDKRCRVIVLNSLGARDTLPFYGLIAQGIPRLMSLDSSSVVDSPAEDVLPFALRHVSLDGNPAIIPNQTELETQLLQSGVRVTEEV